MRGTARRRVFNEDRRRLFGELERPIAFVCECADAECHATVTLTAGEYDAARALPSGLLLASGHLPAETPQTAAAPELPGPDPAATA